MQQPNNTYSPEKGGASAPILILIRELLRAGLDLVLRHG
jgi:hypothetical protein